MTGQSLLPLSRRAMLMGTLAMAGCSKTGTAKPATGPSRAMTLEDAIAGTWRLAADRKRDVWRHPAETLTFWKLQPGQTVVEFWPGAGWYTDILAPFLTSTGGKLYAANLEPTDEAGREVVEAFRQRLKAKPSLYRAVEITAFGPTSGPVAPAGSADLVLFLRNLHNWMAAGIAEKAFRDAFAALKPGGILGIEEHRDSPGAVQDALAPDGYVQQAYAIQLAKEAGFSLDAISEINANPKDDHNHPFGVWTLQPVARSSPRGQPADPTFDRSAYDAIGESDRMTLRFVKPG